MYLTILNIAMTAPNFASVIGIIDSIDPTTATIMAVRDEGQHIARIFCQSWTIDDFIKLVDAFPGDEFNLKHVYAKSIMNAGTCVL